MIQRLIFLAYLATLHLVFAARVPVVGILALGRRARLTAIPDLYYDECASPVIFLVQYGSVICRW